MTSPHGEAPADASSSRTAATAWQAAGRFRLPFGRQAWRGAAGAWQGAGLGSSIDFQDHRPYQPGDDPRYVHWAAYARTGQLTMKLYRAEVAPQVDVMIDVSASMRVAPAKAARTVELASFAVASADRAGAPVRVTAAWGRRLTVVELPALRAGTWTVPESAGDATAAVAPGPLAWRPGALKVLISDLLFPGEPASLLTSLAAGGGSAVVLAPALAGEADLASRGNVELVDCESGVRRHQRVDTALAARYRAAYGRHFELWREAARRCGVALASVPCEGDLAAALAAEAWRAGAVERAKA